MNLKIRLSDELNKKLYRVSDRMEFSKSDLVVELLEFYLEDYEEILEIVDNYEEEKNNGTVVTYTLEEIKKRHGLD